MNPTTTTTTTTMLERHIAASRGQLLAYVRRRVGTPEMAEDIVQDALLRALRAAPDLGDQERLAAWLYRVVQNAIVDTYRRRGVERRTVAGSSADLADLEVSAELDDEASLCECFRGLIPTLNPAYAELISALDLAGEDSGATAARLGITPNNLKVRHHRARQALRKRLEDVCGACAAGHCHDCDCRRPEARSYGVAAAAGGRSV